MLNKITILLGVFSVLLFMSGMILANLQIISATRGMLLFGLGGLIGLLAMMCAVAVLFITQNFPAAMIGLLGLLPLVAVVGSIAEAFRHPGINDITTDLDDPPQFIHATTLSANQGRDMTFPAETERLIREYYPDVTPVLLDMDPEQAHTRALRAAEDLGVWEITHVDAAAGTFEAVATTRMFRWRDDMVVRVRAHNGGSRIDMRSKSRDGRSDLGANARRITAYLDKLRLPPRE